MNNHIFENPCLEWLSYFWIFFFLQLQCMSFIYIYFSFNYHECILCLMCMRHFSHWHVSLTLDAIENLLTITYLIQLLNHQPVKHYLHKELACFEVQNFKWEPACFKISNRNLLVWKSKIYNLLKSCQIAMKSKEFIKRNRLQPTGNRGHKRIIFRWKTGKNIKWLTWLDVSQHQFPLVWY